MTVAVAALPELGYLGFPIQRLSSVGRLFGRVWGAWNA